MSRKLVSAKLPPDLFDRFTEACQRAGLNASQGVCEAIAAWLETDPQLSTEVNLVDRLAAIETRLEALERMAKSSTELTKVDPQFTESTLVDPDEAEEIAPVEESALLAKAQTALRAAKVAMASGKLLTKSQAFDLAKQRGCDVASSKALYQRAKRKPAEIESELGLKFLNNQSSSPKAASFEDVW